MLCLHVHVCFCCCSCIEVQAIHLRGVQAIHLRGVSSNSLAWCFKQFTCVVVFQAIHLRGVSSNSPAWCFKLFTCVVFHLRGVCPCVCVMSSDFSISHEALDAFAEAWAAAARHIHTKVVDDLEDVQENLRNSLCFAAFFAAYPKNI